MTTERIIITGASGFIGSFIVEEALRQGMEVWAAVRKGSSHRYLKDERIHFIELDLSSEEQMVEALGTLTDTPSETGIRTPSETGIRTPSGTGIGTPSETGIGTPLETGIGTPSGTGIQFDYAVHAAGATKALKNETFFKVNTEGTKNFVKALEKTNPNLKRLVYISSLSIFGAIRDQQPYTDILLTDIPQPNTAYGKSKLEAERWLRNRNDNDNRNENDNRNDNRNVEHRGLPFTILRPTGVYGPREQDYKMMADSIKKHIDVASGWSKQDITFVYVRDVVQAVFKSMKSEKSVGKAYFLSDGEVYDSTEFSRLIMKRLGIRWVIRLRLPLCILKAVCAVCEMWSHLTGKMTTLNLDHYNILAQRNWRCDIKPAMEDFGYHPEWKLEDGVNETF